MSDLSTPISRLFLSCDIVGSTKYKQEKNGWQKTFLTFYRGFPQALADEIDGSSDVKFTLWKAVGDELIFTVDLRHERDVEVAVRAWISAMDAFERDTLAPEHLATKGGAFVATFPSPDNQSSIPLNPSSEKSDMDVVLQNDRAIADHDAGQYLFDYFGPSVDTGFRVFSRCSRRYFTLSIEVAYAIAQARSTADPRTKRFDSEDFVFLEEVELKGVWKGRAYPLIAIDRECEDPINEITRLFDHRKIDTRQMQKLGIGCFQDSNWPSRIYLPDSGLSSFSEDPGDAMAELRDTAQPSLEDETDQSDQDLWEELKQSHSEDDSLLPDGLPFSPEDYN